MGGGRKENERKKMSRMEGIMIVCRVSRPSPNWGGLILKKLGQSLRYRFSVLGGIIVF